MLTVRERLLAAQLMFGGQSHGGAKPHQLLAKRTLLPATHTMQTPIATTAIDATTGGVNFRWNHTSSITATNGIINSLAIWRAKRQVGGGGGTGVG